MPPNPTVVIIATLQYKDQTYLSNHQESEIPFVICQLSSGFDEIIKLSKMAIK